MYLRISCAVFIEALLPKYTHAANIIIKLVRSPSLKQAYVIIEHSHTEFWKHYVINQDNILKLIWTIKSLTLITNILNLKKQTRLGLQCQTPALSKVYF